jgi:drug/metabolite transporter (DMT)-like permease
MTFTLVTVSLTGIVLLGLLSVYRIGWNGMFATAPNDLICMLLAGVGNALAFLAIINAIRLTGVVYVNALNATQAALAAVAGILFFQEPLSPWLLVGVALTAVGLLLIRQHRPVGEAVEDPPRR